MLVVCESVPSLFLAFKSRERPSFRASVWPQAGASARKRERERERERDLYIYIIHTHTQFAIRLKCVCDEALRRTAVRDEEVFVVQEDEGGGRREGQEGRKRFGVALGFWDRLFFFFFFFG